jgi:hypothetical protein
VDDEQDEALQRPELSEDEAEIVANGGQDDWRHRPGTLEMAVTKVWSVTDHGLDG